MERVCAAIIIILFSPPFSSSTAAAAAAAAAAIAAAVCWLDLPRDLSPPSFRRSFAVIVTRPPSDKRTRFEFPAKNPNSGTLHFGSGNRALLSVCALAKKRRRTKRAPPPGRERRRRKRTEKGEATRSNIRNRRPPDDGALSSLYMPDL